MYQTECKPKNTKRRRPGDEARVRARVQQVSRVFGAICGNVFQLIHEVPIFLDQPHSKN